MSETTTATEALTELARAAPWGLVKGGDLDSRSDDGDAALRVRLDILEAAAAGGIQFDTDENRICESYTGAELGG